jgi:hypothetical protein
MYKKHCFSRGWAPKSDNMGRYPRLCDYPRRKTDGIFWEDDVEGVMYVLGGPFGRYGRNIFLVSGYEDHAMTLVGSALYIAMLSNTASHARKQR